MVLGRRAGGAGEGSKGALSGGAPTTLPAGPSARYAALMLDRDALRAFVARPWAEIEANKREALAARYREAPEAHVEAVWALYEHLRELRPEGPSDAERAADLEAHLATRRTLDRVAQAPRVAALVAHAIEALRACPR